MYPKVFVKFSKTFFLNFLSSITPWEGERCGCAHGRCRPLSSSSILVHRRRRRRRPKTPPLLCIQKFSNFLSSINSLRCGCALGHPIVVVVRCAHGRRRPSSSSSNNRSFAVYPTVFVKFSKIYFVNFFRRADFTFFPVLYFWVTLSFPVFSPDMYFRVILRSFPVLSNIRSSQPRKGSKCADMPLFPT